MNRIYLDIETLPNQSEEYRAEVRANIQAPAQYKKPDSIAKWLEENGDAAADEQIAKTSFDPALGHVCTIGWAIGDGDAQVVHAEDTNAEALIIEGFFAILPTMGVNQFIGHYVADFDLRFILCRAIVLGIQLPPSVAFPRQPKPWDNCVFDTMTAWGGPKGRISQDNLCRALNLEGKGDVDGSMVAEMWAAGKHQEIADYCKRDVEAVRAIHRKFMAVGY